MNQRTIKKSKGGFDMSVSAIIMMIIGILVIWGGLGASIVHAVIKSKK